MQIMAGALLPLCGALTSCRDQAPQVTEAAAAVMIGAGDIAQCASAGAQLTANIIDTIPGAVFTLGDNAYEDGSTADYQNCYEPTWGRFKSRTLPAPGNHDYVQPNAAPYFAYFGTVAGEPGKGWYGYDLGSWRIIVLNSEVAMNAGSEQETWLRGELARSSEGCVLAYWHKPRFTSGLHENEPAVHPLWEALYQAGADVVLSGHDHDYERFGPQTPAGQIDPSRGIREFVVGTGGAELRTFSNVQPNSEIRIESRYGVLKLTLRPESYRWDFIVAEAPFAYIADSGTAPCH